MNKRILHVNINNQGGAFSLIYQAQIILYKECIFDYFSPNKFIRNSIYNKIIDMDSLCVDDKVAGNKITKQFKIYKEFKLLLSQAKYEIVHIHVDTAWKAAVYLLAAKSMNIPQIIVHSHSCGINGHYRFINRLLHFCFIPVINYFTDVRCACSKKAALWMFNTEKDVLIIKNGVNTEKYRFNEISRNNIRNLYNLNGYKVIGTVGDYSWAKNPKFIKKLIKKIIVKPEYKFLLVGDGAGKEWMEKYFNNKEWSDRIHFTGLVSNTEEFLSAMDIFILPSKFEGIPMSALEAQVNGLYTIVSSNITKETGFSRYYRSIKLNVNEWVNVIEKANLLYDRNNLENYINNEIGISNVIYQLRKVYEINE